MRAGALGDILLLRRAVASLRAAGRDVSLLAPAAAGPVLVGQGPGEVSRLFSWDRAEMAALLTAAGVPAGPLRDELGGFDAAVAYTRNRELVVSLRTLIARILECDPVPPAARHASDWLVQPLVDLGVPRCESVPVLTASGEEAVRGGELLARLPSGFLAVHPGSGSPAKNWPAARFADLVAAHARDRPWLLVVGPADHEAGIPLRRHPNAVVARALPLRVLGAVLAHAGTFVGNDSGVTHLAAAFGAPTIALFGPTDPTVWSPIGPRVTVVRSPSHSLADLPLADVLAAMAG